MILKMIIGIANTVAAIRIRPNGKRKPKSQRDEIFIAEDAILGKRKEVLESQGDDIIVIRLNIE